jgi:hypothetical protein
VLRQVVVDAHPGQLGGHENVALGREPVRVVESTSRPTKYGRGLSFPGKPDAREGMRPMIRADGPNPVGEAQSHAHAKGHRGENPQCECCFGHGYQICRSIVVARMPTSTPTNKPVANISILDSALRLLSSHASASLRSAARNDYIRNHRAATRTISSEESAR